MDISSFEVLIVHNLPGVIVMGYLYHIYMIIGLDIEAGYHLLMNRDVAISDYTCIVLAIPVSASLNFLVMVNRFMTLKRSSLMILL